MTLLYNEDHTSLSTDPSLSISLADGRQVTVAPFRLGVQQTFPRPFVTRHAMPPPQIANIRQLAESGTIPTQTPQKAPPATPAHLRISGMRAPSVPNIAISPPSNATAVSTSPPHPNGTALGSPIKSPGLPDLSRVTDEGSTSLSVSPIRPKSTQAVSVPVANGYHLPATNGYTLPNGGTYLPQANGPGLSPQQRQNVLTAFGGTGSSVPIAAGVPPSGGPMIHDPMQDVGNALPGQNNGGITNGHLNLQLPLARQKQWLANTQRVQVNPDGSVVHSPNMGHAQIAGMTRVPSANGLRGTPMMSHVMGAQQGRASPAMEHMHSSPIPGAASPAQPSSSPRPPSQASLIMSPPFQQQLISPSMGHQQVTVQQAGSF